MKMTAWIAANIGTIVIFLVLCVIAAGAAAVLVKDKKKGKCSCGGNCGHCPMDGSCHKH